MFVTDIVLFLYIFNIDKTKSLGLMKISLYFNINFYFLPFHCIQNLVGLPKWNYFIRCRRYAYISISLIKVLLCACDCFIHEEYNYFKYIFFKYG